MAKVLILLGMFLVVIGVVMQYADKIPWWADCRVI